MAERWVQPELPMQATTVGGRVDVLAVDLLDQLPVSAWSRVEVVELPDRDVIARRLAEVSRC